MIVKSAYSSFVRCISLHRACIVECHIYQKPFPNAKVLQKWQADHGTKGSSSIPGGDRPVGIWKADIAHVKPVGNDEARCGDGRCVDTDE